VPLGDKALVVEFGNVISLEINRKVHALHDVLLKTNILGVEECVPTYRSLLIIYDPAKLDYEKLVFAVKDLEGTLTKHINTRKGRKAIIPVVYGGDFGTDLSTVAQYHNLKESEVIRVHSEPEYMVYMIGFIAGFPYLGELADEIATPRLESPRVRVPEGSVGIAEKQTGIYPREAPGGWRIIGKTPIRLFDASWQPPALLQAGDSVKFKPISAEEFQQIRASVFKEAYDPFVVEE
jgi:inhibitor of KinA